MKKTFNITDQDVLDHLSQQGNQSNYVTALIKQDMNKSPSTGLTRTEVAKIVYEILQEYNFKKSESRVELSENTKSAILNVLGK